VDADVEWWPLRGAEGSLNLLAADIAAFFADLRESQLE